MSEAKLEKGEHGLTPQGEGWFILNAKDACWWSNEKFGTTCAFEGESRFAELGINLHVLMPGQPNCMYHGESAQEDFLVLSGDCLVLIDGQERKLKAWDLVHCPPWTEHVFVGAGSGPCVILMTGARRPGVGIRYPVAPVAMPHGACVEVETPSPAEAYAAFPKWSEGPPFRGLS